MMLAERQTLYLECAEDFDLLSEGESETYQVKNSGKNITLASSDVRDAIANFWSLLERNQDRASITMRFLTRGGVGAEKGRPFDGEKGIEVWRKAAAGDDEAAVRLARHLGATLKPPTLKAFLRSADAADLSERVFRRIVWATGEPSVDAVRLAVERMAIRLGSVREIGAKECLSAVDGLLAHCRNAATRSEPELRSLTVEDKTRVFEEKTSISLPATRGMLATLARALSTNIGSSLALAQAIAFAPAAIGVEPSLPPFVLPRASFVEKIIQRGSPALIVGSEGRGKTTVASLVGKRLGGVNWWADLSSVDESSLPAALDRMLLELRNADEGQVVVLDDFPIGNAIAQAAWVRFNVIVEECARRCHFLAITAKGVHPGAVDPRLRTAQIAIHSVPDLSIDEIATFASTLGCPDEARDQWASTIGAQSGGGHPKLVHLLGLELRDRGWAEPIGAFLDTPPRSIEEAKAFARKEAARTLPEEERELLYALSLALYPLDRQAVLLVGEQVGGCRSPGDTLDKLAGRWVETQGATRYRVTALLTGQANFAWSPSKIEGAHARLFDAMVQNRSITIDQAFPIFMHAWLSGDEARFAGYLASLASERDNLAEYLAPAMLIARGKNAAAGRFSARTLALLKTVQFRVARRQDLAQLLALAGEWSDTIARISEERTREENRMLWAFSVVDLPERVLPAPLLVHAFEEIDRLEYLEPKNAFNEGVSADLSPYGVEANSDTIATLFGFNFARCDDLDFVRELLEALEKANSKARGRMLNAFNIPFFKKNHLFVDGPWINESKREQPRWILAEETLRRMLALADEWQCRSLAIPVARTLSILFENHLDRHDDAIACLREVSTRFGDSSVLIAQEATLLFGRNEHRPALGLWEKSLWRPENPDPDSERDPQTLRKAGIAAGSLRNFGSASKWFEYAAASGRDMAMPATAGGALFDAAYCAFKDGALARAVSLAHAGLSAFEKDFDPAKQFDLFAAKKLGGHVLFWILEQLRGSLGKEPAVEPVLGQCSNSGRNKTLAELPPVSSDMAAAMLVEIASLLKVKNADIGRLRTRLETARLPLASHQYWSLRCNEAMESGRLEELGDCLLRLRAAIWSSIAQRREGKNTLLPFIGSVEEADRATPLGMEAVFLAALLLRALSGGSPDKLTNHWVAALQEQPHSAPLIDEARRALAAFSIDTAKARALFPDGNAPALARLGAACHLLAAKPKAPETTAQVQWVALLWLRHMPSVLTFDAILPPLAKALAGLWRDHMGIPALLRVPRISVPLLKGAVENDSNAPQQLIALMSAAESATGVSASKTIIDELRASTQIHAARLPW
jgi:hypothetical protein